MSSRFAPHPSPLPARGERGRGRHSRCRLNQLGTSALSEKLMPLEGQLRPWPMQSSTTVSPLPASGERARVRGSLEVRCI
ncbi:hypothetical protein SAMCCGM7_Ch2568 [Sinorhizobium americanum CCGM7]|nr:hypothetical protein SAMCCGM7_Ch2568 [Sinorhizobium americanum CCGM7]